MKRIWFKYNDKYPPKVDELRKLAEAFRKEPESNHIQGKLSNANGCFCAGDIALREAGYQTHKLTGFFILPNGVHWSECIKSFYHFHGGNSWATCCDTYPGPNTEYYWGFAHLNDGYPQLTFAQFALVIDAYADRKEYVDV